MEIEVPATANAAPQRLQGSPGPGGFDGIRAKCRGHSIPQLLQRTSEDLAAWSREMPASHMSRSLIERSSTVTPRRHAGGYAVEWQMLGARIGQRAEQHLAVVPRHDTAVEEHDGAVVGLGADQPAEALA